MKRAFVGLVIGLLVGACVAAIGLAVTGSGPSLGGGWLALVVLLGGLQGIPVGGIVAFTSAGVEYRSGWGYEWALVGAVGAGLAIVASGRMQTSAQLTLLATAMLAGALVERATATLFHDQVYSTRVTGGTAAIYLLAAALIGVSYLVLLGGLVAVVD